MKKTLLLFSFLISIQFLFSQNFSIGISGGINKSYLKFDQENIYAWYRGLRPTKAKPGFTFSTTLSYHINKMLTLQSGTTYIRKGDTTPNENIPGHGNWQTNLDYLQIPLIVKINFFPKKRLFFKAGYNFSFLQKAELKPMNFSDDIRVVHSEIQSRTEKVDYSFLVGAGLQIPVNNHLDINFEGRWEHGLTTVSKLIGGVVKNRTLLFTLGMDYHLVRKN